jgi:hypothetical protein
MILYSAEMPRNDFCLFYFYYFKLVLGGCLNTCRLTIFFLQRTVLDNLQKNLLALHAFSL